MRHVILILALLVSTAGWSHAQQIDLTNVIGLYAPDTIHAGQPVTFEFNWNNSGSTAIKAWANGFRFWMVGGSRTRTARIRKF